MSVIKTLSQTLNKPVVSVDTLEILRNQLNIKDIKIVPAIDALRNEVFVKEKDKIVIVPIETFVKKLKKHKDKVIIIGNAAMVYSKILSKELGKNSVNLQPNLHFPKASTLALMAENIDGTSFKNVEPIYGRKSWAEEKQKS